MSRGHALALALLMIATAGILGAALWNGYQSFSGRAAQRMSFLQARYLAESAIRWQAYRILVPRRDSARDPETQWCDIGSAFIQVDSGDFWLRIYSLVDSGAYGASVEAELGKPLHREAFRYAIRLMDPEPLRDREMMRVRGEILEKNQPSLLSNEEVRSKLMNLPSRSWNRYERAWLRVFSDPKQHSAQGFFRGRTRILRPEDWNMRLIAVENGDLTIDLPRATHLSGTWILAVQGEVSLRGEFFFDTLIVMADGPVSLGGVWRGRRLEIFSRARIQLTVDMRTEAALYAQGSIGVMGTPARLQGTSALVTYRVSQNPQVGRGQILLDGDTEFQGWILCAGQGGDAVRTGTQSSSADEFPGIWIRNRVRVYGVVFSAYALRHQGFIGGVVVTNRLDCGDMRRAQCGGTGVFDRDSLPPGFWQPLALDFGERIESWRVRNWRVR